jgi:hypothetical protein
MSDIMEADADRSRMRTREVDGHQGSSQAISGLVYTAELANEEERQDGFGFSPQWSSGQSSWLQIQRPGFDSRRYQIF